MLIKGGTPVRGTRRRGARARRAGSAECCRRRPHAAARPARACTRRPATPATRASTPTSTWSTTRRRTSSSPGTHVDLQQRATQCLTDVQPRLRAHERLHQHHGPGPEPDGPVDHDQRPVPATFTFKQPTYPGNPNGLDDPEPARARRVELQPGQRDQPEPAGLRADRHLRRPAGRAVPGEQARDHAGRADPGRHGLQGRRSTTSGRPGVHVDGDGATEGWFRNNNPVGDGGFMTTEPVGSMAWMPLNNHPTVKPTYEFWSTTNWDADDRHRPHRDLQRPPDRLHRQRRRTRTSPAARAPGTGSPRSRSRTTWSRTASATTR